MTEATITVYEDEGGQWRWRLDLGNGQTFASSGEAFHSRDNAHRAAGRLAELIVEEGAVTITEENR